MKLEAAHAVEITKLVEYVDREEDLLIQVVRTYLHNTDSAVLQTARCPKTEVQRETRKQYIKIHDSFIHSFTLFSLYPYTGKVPRCGNCQSSCTNIC